MFLDRPELDALVETLDKRYCHPATAAAVDPDVGRLIDHAVCASNACETEEEEHADTQEELDRLRETVSDIVLQMERKGTFNARLEQAHADDLLDWVQQFREFALKKPEPSL